MWPEVAATWHIESSNPSEIFLPLKCLTWTNPKDTSERKIKKHLQGREQISQTPLLRKQTPSGSDYGCLGEGYYRDQTDLNAASGTESATVLTFWF